MGENTQLADSEVVGGLTSRDAVEQFLNNHCGSGTRAEGAFC